MRVLAMGGSGMLGHKAFQVLNRHFDTYVSFRESGCTWHSHPLYADADASYLLGGVDATDSGSVAEVLHGIRPGVVVNCIGIVKQRSEAADPIPSVQVNALFPHQLAHLCRPIGARLIHMSTDCVFSGRRGHYREADPPDPVDLYGRAKLLGDVGCLGCLTLRTSMVGWELRNRTGLLEWFASQRGHGIKGYCRAIYTGLTAATLAVLMRRIIEEWPGLTGLYHIAGTRISKYDLLECLCDALDWKDISIEPDDGFVCDRSLVGERFESETGWQAPGWDEMVRELAIEWPTYESWRRLE